MHPETKHGAAPGKAGGGKKKRESGQNVHFRYTAAAAKATGKSERTVRRAVRRGAVLGGTILGKVKGTSLDPGGEVRVVAAKAGEEVERR